MSELLEPAELDALLQQQAFATPRWRKLAFWLLLAALPVTCGLALHPWLSAPPLSQLPRAVRWGESPTPLTQSEQSCLSTWAERHNLAAAARMILAERERGATLVWLGKEDNRTLVLAKGLPELCR